MLSTEEKLDTLIKSIANLTEILKMKHHNLDT